MLVEGADVTGTVGGDNCQGFAVGVGRAQLDAKFAVAVGFRFAHYVTAGIGHGDRTVGLGTASSWVFPFAKCS